MTKRKNISIKKTPTNYAYWLCVLANKKDVESFLSRGNQRQITSLRNVLESLRKRDNDKFLNLNGEELQKRVEVAYDKFTE